ncbi:Glycoside hydrolase family 18 protein [Mycena indigotica]|uniref:Glycoside hydrolase family 18 protein n=1 Tax=Mycena indigotica TaxID=2126181 RepID=A0A8H6TCS6_9AGAR|nr:Glycoside hydrolase family 18 protein [Mycena indigotica]KAF7315066.1 Glycoside hydrolase family 18 protein [Mycena indigotica]
MAAWTLSRNGIPRCVALRSTLKRGANTTQFVTLHAKLGIKDFDLPPKRILVTTFLPSAWIDDTLIAERKSGLQEYLVQLLQVPQYRHDDIVQEFIAPTVTNVPLQEFELEDAVPSTLSRKAAENLIEAVAAAAVQPIAAAYYPTWTMDSNPPERLDYSKFDVLFVAFGAPSTSGGVVLGYETQSMLRRLVPSARKSGKGTKIVLSIGGWTDSGPFHQMAASSSSRSKFVSGVSKVVSEYGLDGVDIDWEYPNSPGNGNPFGPADAANFLLLLKALRASLGWSKIISTAVTDLPWLGSNGAPLRDVSEYAAQLTYVNIMNYDINGGWSASPGPNAPLGDACGRSSQPQYTAKAAFNQWTAAKCPASKLLLGLPLYGYVFRSTKTTLSSFVELDVEDPPTEIPPGIEPTQDSAPVGPIRGGNRRIIVPDDPETEPEVPDETPLTETPHPLDPEVEPTTGETDAQAVANLSKWWGQAIPFNSLLASGALIKKQDGSYGAGSGYTLSQDQCSTTPFLYNTARATVVSFDDTHSLADKAAFVKSKGMGGVFTWSLDQDDGVTLQNAIRKALGKK